MLRPNILERGRGVIRPMATFGRAASAIPLVTGLPFATSRLATALLAITLLATSGLPGTAHGQTWSDFYWDANGESAGTGGTGPWDLTDSFWRSGSSTGTLGAWVNTGDNRARFEGTAGTVTIADGVHIQAGGIDFGTIGYVIDRAGTGSLELLPGATAPVPTISANSSATMVVPISGTAGFNKTGLGTLTLSGSSTYSGTTTVTAGALQVAAPFALGATGVGNEVTVANAARLELANGVTVSGKAVSIIGQGGSDASGALRAASGTATWAGDVLIPTSGLSGAPRIGAGEAGATLEVSGVISGGMSQYGVAFRGFVPDSSRDVGNGGRVVVSGVNTYVGPTDVVAGALALSGGDDRLPTATVLRIGNTLNTLWASFDLAGHSQRVAGLENVGNNTVMPRVVTNSAATPSTLTIGRDADEGFAFIGTITDNLAVVKTGSNSLQLTGASTFSGGTQLEGGVLRIGLSAGEVGAITSSPIGTGTLTLAGGRLTSSFSTTRTILNAVMLGGDVTLGDTASGFTGGLQFLAPVALTASRTLTIDSPVEFAGAIGEATGGLGLVKQGAATLTLSAANTYTGTTSVVSGTLAIGNGTTNGAVLGPIDTTADTTVLFTTIASSSQTHAAAIGGGGGLVKAGSGMLTLSGANGYTGGTTVSAGALIYSGTAAIGGTGANVVIATGATAALEGGPLADLLARVDATSTGAVGLMSSTSDAIDLSGYASLGLAAIGDVVYSGVLTPSGTTYRLGGSGGRLTLDLTNQLTGSRDVIISGSVAYAATMNYAGPTTVDGGTLAFTGDDRLPTAAAVTLGGGSAGVLDLRGTTQTLTSIATVGSGNSVGNSSTTADATLAFDPGVGVSTTYAGDIVDALGGGTRQTGVAIRSGTVTFTGESAYTGDTLVAGGATLELARAARYVFGSTVTGEGGVRFSGGIGTRQPILTAQSTYSGGSEIAEAFVRIGTSSTVSGGEIVSGPLGTGTVTVTAGGLSSDSTESRTVGNPVVFGGTVQLGSGVPEFSGELVLSGSATLTGSRTLDVRSPVVLSGPIGESGGSHGLTKSGDGMLTLSGQSTYSGATTISSGTLLLAGGANRLPAGGGVVVNGVTAVLDLGGQSQSVAGNVTVAGNGLITNGTLTTLAADFTPGVGTGEIAAVLAGDVGLVKNATGVLTLSGHNLYTGTTTVSGGVLRVASGLALGGTTAGTVVTSGNRLELAGGVVVTGESLAIAGNGGNNNGALQSQSGDNTWAGPIVLSAASTRIGGLLGTTLRVSGEISGTGPLIMRPEGSVTSTAVIELSGANTYSGGTVVYAGTLRLAGGDDRLPTTGGLTIGLNGNTLYGSVDLGGFNQTVAGLSSVGNNQPLQVIGNSSTTADSTLRVNLGSGTNTFAGQLVDTIGAGTRTFALTKAGSGTLVLSGTQNTFSGDTLLEGGVLRITDGLALQHSTLHTGSGSAGSIQFSGFTSGTLGGLRGSNNLVLSNTSGAALALTVGGNGRSTVFSGELSGGGSLTKTGSGSLTLAGLNTYAGATQIEAGRLLLTGTLGGSGVSVASGAVLGGTGRVSAPTTIAAGGILAPGASTGRIEFTSGLTWGGGGVLQFEINDATGTAGSTTSGWDLIDVTSGSFAITATSADPFTIDMITLTATQEPGLANFNNSIDHAWLLLQHTTEIGAFDTDAFLFVTTNFQNPLFPGAGFGLFRGDSSLVQGLISGATNDQLYIVYTVPEPTGLILAGLGLAAAAALTRKRAVTRKRP